MKQPDIAWLIFENSKVLRKGGGTCISTGRTSCSGRSGDAKQNDVMSFAQHEAAML